MGKMGQRYIATAPDRLADAERDRRILSGVMVATCTELATVASELGRLADTGRPMSPKEVRAIAASLEYFSRELREWSRYEGAN